MDQGTDTKSPPTNRSEVIEKRMAMLAALFDKLNEEASAEQQIVKENNKESFLQREGIKFKIRQAVAGIFFHRVE
ncbi:hypothetical protein [Paenibacillus sp. NEAU-GSW1]|uniref:hypothetical protein n=1 Tax=Paenibacillus sp. NEAU-GSW1 TaxID=2682486 RepID=UPI0012E1C61D|nr:hypothetical protein [Paenibacillus sp. NEAU-GSW1]MUT67874.1 hypothetical protein [Paenibacillus sp. NEAU-GSW1]